jgi:hypothetical protein
MELLIFNGAAIWNFAVDNPPTRVVKCPDLGREVWTLSGESGGDVVFPEAKALMLHEGRPTGHVSAAVLSPGDVVVAW